MKASVFIGTSLDGFIARENGDLDFLPPGGGEPHGYEEFMATVDALVIGLWLFYRSHADLGTNWSITLEVREEHRLITEGVYRGVRHPMYSALLLYSVGQALVIPNWVAGPSNLLAFAVLLALRIRAEERMMNERFGDEYAAYSARTKRLIPGVW